MPIKILMPALSPTMTEGNLAKWLKKEGDAIKAGEVIAEIETDKATMEVEAVDEGVLAKITVEAGTENVAVNSLIAVLLEDGEDEAALDEFIKKKTTTTQETVAPSIKIEKASAELLRSQKEDTAQTIVADIKTSQDSRIFASPLAKRIAKDKGINLSNITGSGPYGRIVKTDVMNSSGTAQIGTKSSQLKRNPEEYNLSPNSTMRKIIAKRLLESKQTIPHFYLSIECNVDKLLEIRADINSACEDKASKISVNDFIVAASAKALNQVKQVNSSFEESAIKYYNNIDISVAVATDFGLITPIIKNVDQKDITTISREMKELASRAKVNKLAPEEFQGGGFTISNLGMFDIDHFSAIINPPQSCILAVGASSKKAVVINDQIKVANIMNVTISCDHRVVDGVIGAKFLSVFKRYIEQPALLLI